MGTTEYANPAASAAAFLPSATKKPEPEDDIVGDLDQDDDSGSGVGNVISTAASGFKDALLGSDDEEPVNKPDPETLAAAQKYIETLFPGQQHLRHMSDLSAQLGHPMTTTEVAGHEGDDRARANDLEQRRLLDTLAGSGVPDVAQFARSQPNQHALYAALNPAGHQAAVMAGHVPAMIAETLASAKNDYERARTEVASQHLRAAYNAIPDTAVRASQAVLGATRRAMVAQKAAADVRSLIDAAAAHAMVGHPAAVPPHLTTHAERIQHQLGQIAAALTGPTGTPDKASE